MATWVTEYKGHTIRVQDDRFFGERLFIDGTMSRARRPWFRREIRGRITDGDGAGEEVVATLSGSWTARCTLAINGAHVHPQAQPQIRELVSTMIVFALVTYWLVTQDREGKRLEWSFFLVAAVLTFIASVSAILQYRSARLAQRNP